MSFFRRYPLSFLLVFAPVALVLEYRSPERTTLIFAAAVIACSASSLCLVRCFFLFLVHLSLISTPRWATRSSKRRI